MFFYFLQKQINGKFDDVEKLVLLMVFFDNKFVGNKKAVYKLQTTLTEKTYKQLTEKLTKPLKIDGFRLKNSEI